MSEAGGSDSAATGPKEMMARVGTGRANPWLYLLIWLPYAFLVRRFWFVSDDAYISFRFSRNWAEGLGLRYNFFDGPPEEGFSNFLYVAFGALAHSAGLLIEFWLPFLSFISGSLLLFALLRLFVKRFDAPQPVAVLATLVLALCAPLAVWSSSGLETVLYALLVFLAFERLILREVGAAGLTAGFLAALMALTRVEGVYWAIVLIPLTILSRRMRDQACFRPLVAYASMLGLGYGSWFLWKYQYYGHAFAATVHSKMGFSGDRLLRGMQYVGTQYLESLWLLVLVPGAFVALRAKRRAIGLPVLLMPLGFASLATLISGDFMTFGRFLVPALSFHAILLCWLLQDLWESGTNGRAISWVIGGAGLVLAILPGFNLSLVPASVRQATHFRRRTDNIRSEYEVWHSMRQNAILWRIRGKALSHLFDPGETIVMSAIGAAGFESGLNVLDRHGFVTPEVAMRELTPEELAAPLRSPGHDHPVSPRFFIEQGMEPVVLRTGLFVGKDRRQIAAEFRKFRRFCIDMIGADLPYDLDFRQIPFENESGKALYLCLWRRVEDWPGAEVQDALVKERIEAFARKGKLSVIDMPATRWRLAGLPTWLAPDVPLPDQFGGR